MGFRDRSMDSTTYNWIGMGEPRQVPYKAKNCENLKI
jgi:hypothetical protein